LKAVQGHEIWVLAESSHGHPRHRVAGRVFYGHAMHPDGLADISRLKAFAVGPDRERVEAILEEGKRDFHAAVFTPEQEGMWTLAVEYDIGPLVVTGDGQYKRGTRRDYPDARQAAYYYQYARTCIPVGHHLEHDQGRCHRHEHHEKEGHACCGHQHAHGSDHHEEFSFAGHQLEIAVLPAFCRKGDDATVEVRYRGQLLPEADLGVTWSFYEKGDYPCRVKTDAAGRARVPLRAEGHWLFHVRHEDSREGIEGEYDRKVYSATYTIFGVR